jgi:PQQ-dependent catabolism-associated CXXCW motif protein
VAAIESQDFGVKPTDRLQGDPMHAPTPTTIPGGLVISTEALNGLYENSRGRFMVFDVLGGRTGLPVAQNALPAGNAGSFDDQTQREFGNYLQQVTAGDKEVPLVFYCQSVECWMSYNAALRAIRLGYTQVLWYRGGIEAWEQAKLPTQPR